MVIRLSIMLSLRSSKYIFANKSYVTNLSIDIFVLKMTKLKTVSIPHSEKSIFQLEFVEVKNIFKKAAKLEICTAYS